MPHLTENPRDASARVGVYITRPSGCTSPSPPRGESEGVLSGIEGSSCPPRGESEGVLSGIEGSAAVAAAADSRGINVLANNANPRGGSGVLAFAASCL